MSEKSRIGDCGTFGRGEEAAILLFGLALVIVAMVRLYRLAHGVPQDVGEVLLVQTVVCWFAALVVSEGADTLSEAAPRVGALSAATALTAATLAEGLAAVALSNDMNEFAGLLAAALSALALLYEFLTLRDARRELRRRYPSTALSLGLGDCN